MDKSFRDVFLVLKKRGWTIGLTVVFTVALAGILSFYVIQPTYEATSQFIVNDEYEQRLSEVSIEKIRTNVELINTYNVVIKSPAILDKVIDRENLSMSDKELSRQLDVSSAEDSQVVAVTVTDDSHERAVRIANATVDVFQNEISHLMNIDNVRILSTAEVEKNPSPVAPNPMLNIAIGLLLGIMLGVAIALFKEYMDFSIKTKRDLQECIDIPVVGVISRVEEKDLKSMNEEASQRTRSQKGAHLHVVKKSEKIG
ncbi:capsular biosynthesis protein [Halobacillus yeomjeoni]|uniref:YveK family protein n=1 Tax=Halobacillus yeomjeoni TaxID=311194 RepID=UPI001CD6DA26|nr:Wzz/FepE/Etk N-terminal domain-containing protein [Halobacillus yeomjeoni]MCA0985138.1 capsular biosynthesis protein [Halobacillus yeomjeoni]